MTCEDCVRCEADGCDTVAYCLSQPGAHPCPHDKALCENHNIEECIDCRLEAEREMYRSGEYSRRADPFVNHLAPPARDHIAEQGGYYWDGSWVARPPKDAS